MQLKGILHVFFSISPCAHVNITSAKIVLMTLLAVIKPKADGTKAVKAAGIFTFRITASGFPTCSTTP